MTTENAALAWGAIALPVLFLFWQGDFAMVNSDAQSHMLHDASLARLR